MILDSLKKVIGECEGRRKSSFETLMDASLAKSTREYANLERNCMDFFINKLESIIPELARQMTDEVNERVAERDTAITEAFKDSTAAAYQRGLADASRTRERELLEARRVREALRFALKTAEALVYHCGHPRGGCPNHCNPLVKVIDASRAALAAKAEGSTL